MLCVAFQAQKTVAQ